jgi:hypothetical protein
MSNKKETPVNWLGLEIKKFNTVITREYLLSLINQALEMESKKQQKYDEMMAMLESILKISSEGYDLWETELDACIKKSEQLIKEAKEL